MATNIAAHEISATVCLLVRERLAPLLHDYGLSPALFNERVSVELRDLGTRCVGLCSFQSWRITLSFNTRCWSLLSDFERADTIAHELAHAVDAVVRGDTNHDPVWRSWAVLLGAVPRARAQWTLATAQIVDRAMGGRNRFSCPGCGERLRFSPTHLKELRQGANFRCPGCKRPIQAPEVLAALETPR